MAFYCIYCGTGLPNDANFCLKCGKPLKDSTTSENAQIARQQLYLDWSGKTEIKYSTSKNNEQRAEAIAMQRIEDELKPYIDEGWALDGSFGSAVTVERKPFGLDGVLYTGASVKLCRDCEGC